MAEGPAPTDGTTPAPKRQGNISFAGTSGRQYAFQVWPMDTRFKPVAAVYFVTKRAYRNRTYHTASHDAIYIGQTDSLADAFSNTASLERFQKFEANCVCVHPLADPAQNTAEILSQCTAGDDYRILLSAVMDTAMPGFTAIGKLTAEAGLRLIHGGQAVNPPSILGFEH